MLSATFFGHRDFDYSPYKDRLLEIITGLIENYGVREFYKGFRGNFDRLCADFIVSGVRFHYGGAYAALNFAKRNKKIILDIFEDK